MVGSKSNLKPLVDFLQSKLYRWHSQRSWRLRYLRLQRLFRDLVAFRTLDPILLDARQEHSAPEVEEDERTADHDEPVPCNVRPALERALHTQQHERHRRVVHRGHGADCTKNVVDSLEESLGRCVLGTRVECGRKQEGTEGRACKAACGRDEAAEEEGEVVASRNAVLTK